MAEQTLRKGEVVGSNPIVHFMALSQLVSKNPFEMEDAVLKYNNHLARDRLALV